MATHNPAPAFLTRQVASLRAQSEPNWQCLVLDDASRNRSEVAGQLTDSRFRLLPAGPHLGPYLAFERLLAASDPQLPVFLCDQDDCWRPDKVARLLGQGPVAAVFSAMRVVDERGDVLRERFLPHRPDPPALTPSALLLMNTVSGAALLVSPEVRMAALPFPAPGLRGWHDQWLAAVAARLGEVAYLDEPLVDYTRHTGQVTGDGLRRITVPGLRRYAQRLREAGPRQELRSRSGWVRAAARRLLELPGPDDPELESLAAGRWAAPLARGVRAGRVPVSRAVLLAAGRVLGPVD